MNTIIYVNTPLLAEEHAALESLAKREGRAKGKQLRALAIERLLEMGLLKSTPKKKNQMRKGDAV